MRGKIGTEGEYKISLSYKLAFKMSEKEDDKTMVKKGCLKFPSQRNGERTSTL